MPIIDTVEVTIGRRVKITGPAVDSLNIRKENNNHNVATDAELRANLASIRSSFSELRKLDQQ